MEKLLESVTAEATVMVLGAIAALVYALREAGKKLIARGAKLAELRLEVEIARLEQEKLEIAAAAGSRIAEVATKPAADIRGYYKKSLAIEQAAELLGVSPHADPPAELTDAVQAAYERDEERRSLEPDALTPAETPTAKAKARKLPAR